MEAVTIKRRDGTGPYQPLGHFVRRLREQRGLSQGETAAKAEMRQAQLSLLESGENVEIRFYDKVARAIGFRGALDMFMSGGDEKTRRLLRFWRALPDEEARTDVLQLMRDQIVADEAPGATAAEGPAIEKPRARGRTGN